MNDLSDLKAREMVRKVVDHINDNLKSHTEKMEGYADCIFIISRGIERNDIPSIATAGHALDSLHHAIRNAAEDLEALSQDPDKIYNLYREGGALS